MIIGLIFMKIKIIHDFGQIFFMILADNF